MVRTVLVDWSLLESKPLLEKFHKAARIAAFLKAVDGPGLFQVADTVRKCRLIDDVVIISKEPFSLPETLKGYVGTEKDDVSLYRAAARDNPCDYAVILPSNFALDPHLIDFIVAASIGHDYGSNCLTFTFPDGMDIEVISSEALGYIDSNSLGKERELLSWVVRNRQDVQISLDLVSVQAVKDNSYISLEEVGCQR